MLLLLDCLLFVCLWYVIFVRRIDKRWAMGKWLSRDARIAKKSSMMRWSWVEKVKEKFPRFRTNEKCCTEYCTAYCISYFTWNVCFPFIHAKRHLCFCLDHVHPTGRVSRWIKFPLNKKKLIYSICAVRMRWGVGRGETRLIVVICL